MLESVLLALYYLIESIQAQKYEKKPYFELLYPSPIDVNHGAVGQELVPPSWSPRLDEVSSLYQEM